MEDKDSSRAPRKAAMENRSNEAESRTSKEPTKRRRQKSSVCVCLLKRHRNNGGVPGG